MASKRIKLLFDKAPPTRRQVSGAVQEVKESNIEDARQSAVTRTQTGEKRGSRSN
jgi:hypothetical protein